jgi:hypothetical protein
MGEPADGGDHLAMRELAVSVVRHGLCAYLDWHVLPRPPHGRKCTCHPCEDGRKAQYWLFQPRTTLTAWCLMARVDPRALREKFRTLTMLEAKRLQLALRRLSYTRSDEQEADEPAAEAEWPEVQTG